MKQGKYLPGTHIPIYPPEQLAETQPDYVLVLPWNLREETLCATGLRPFLGSASGFSYSGTRDRLSEVTQ